MYLGKQWVPMNVMSTIFLLWFIATVIVLAVLFWLHRKGRKALLHKKQHISTAPTKKRNRKNKALRRNF